MLLALSFVSAVAVSANAAVFASSAVLTRLPESCSGIAIIRKADAAYWASDNERATKLYQQGIESVSECIDAAGHHVPPVFYYTSGAARLQLMALFERAKRHDDALKQYVAAELDLVSACVEKPIGLDLTRTRLGIGTYRAAGITLGDPFDADLFSDCMPRR